LRWFIYFLLTSAEIRNAYKNIQTSAQVFSDTMNFLKKCPTATIIKNIDSNHTFWLCHGFIPIFSGINQMIKDFIDSKNNIFLPPIKTIMKQIRWNDPHYCMHISCIDDMNNTIGTSTTHDTIINVANFRLKKIN
jgi:hypothetical protein